MSKPKKVVKRPRRPKPRKNRIDVGDVFLQGLRKLVSGVTQVGGTLLLVALTPEEDIEAAGGDIIEAANGHRCGPKCWHAVGKTAAERQAWWDAKMTDYREACAAREKLRKKDWLGDILGGVGDGFEKPKGT